MLSSAELGLLLLLAAVLIALDVPMLYVQTVVAPGSSTKLLTWIPLSWSAGLSVGQLKVLAIRKVATRLYLRLVPPPPPAGVPSLRRLLHAGVSAMTSREVASN
jgi:hypothetical protein